MSYNGWTNFETWKMNLEVFADNYSIFYMDDPEGLEEYAEGCVQGNEFTTNLAFNFLKDVNFQEIYEAIQDEYTEFYCLNCKGEKDNATEYCSKKCKEEHLAGYTEE